MSLYNIAQPVGAMLSGAIQGSLATNLDGSLGRAGWRWAFIINVTQLFLSPVLLDEAILHLTLAPWWLKEIKQHYVIGDFAHWRRPYHYQAALNRLLDNVQHSRL